MKLPKRIDLLLFVIALVFLSFMAGAAAVHFDNLVGFKLKSAFDGFTVWSEQRKAERIEQIEMDREKNTTVKVTTLKNKVGTYQGYTLYSLYNEQRARLVDMGGRQVHEWYKPFNEAFPAHEHVSKPKGRIYWAALKLFPNGDLLAQYHGAIDTPYGYGLVKLDKDSKVIWTYASNTHHEFDVASNGNIYGISQKWYKEPIPDFSDIVSPPAFLDSVFVLTPEGKEIKKVDLIDAFRGTPYQKLLYMSSTVWKLQGDYFHTNSIHVLREGVPYKIPGVKPGMVLLSIRNPSLLSILDLDTKRVVWAAKGD